MVRAGCAAPHAQPKVVEPGFISGAPNSTRLNALNISQRSCNFALSRMLMVFKSERSQLLIGPLRTCGSVYEAVRKAQVGFVRYEAVSTQCCHVRWPEEISELVPVAS